MVNLLQSSGNGGDVVEFIPNCGFNALRCLQIAEEGDALD